ncbi:MAG: hypothetical protein CSA83_00555 [Actinomycetales bacterium]|nr:MAG: hypothetical protein CSA83_00555 [Actinomycetales bacterium]
MIVLAEARRMLAGRMWWILLLTGVALAMLIVVSLLGEHSTAIVAGSGSPHAAADDATRYWMIGYLLCALMAALAISTEFQDGQIKRSVLLQRADRSRVVWVKLGGVLIVSVVFGVVAVIGAVISPLTLPGLFGISSEGVSVDWQIVGGIFLINILAAGWGFAIGMLFRSPVLSVVFILVQTLLIETYGAKAVPAVGKYLLTSVFGSLYKDPGPLSMDMLPALAIACAWVIAAIVFAAALFRRRDI